MKEREGEGEREKERERESDRQTDRQREREKYDGCVMRERLVSRNDRVTYDFTFSSIAFVSLHYHLHRIVICIVGIKVQENSAQQPH